MWVVYEAGSGGGVVKFVVGFRALVLGARVSFCKIVPFVNVIHDILDLFFSAVGI